MSRDKQYKETLAEWRRKHFKEMDANLEINVQIRDDSNEKAKDRIDASKTIARMLGTLAPEKIEKKEVAKEKEASLTDEDNKKLETLLKETLGDSWTGLKKNT